MKKIKFKSDFKYKFTIVSISLLLLISIFSFNYTKDNFFVLTTIVGLLSFIIILLSAIGLYKSIKKLRQPTSKKRIALLLIIAAIVSIFTYLIVANTIDAFKNLT